MTTYNFDAVARLGREIPLTPTSTSLKSNAPDETVVTFLEVGSQRLASDDERELQPLEKEALRMDTTLSVHRRAIRGELLKQYAL